MITFLIVLLGLWAVGAISAWIFLMYVVNRRYYTPIDINAIYWLGIFFILGPLAWLAALVIKGIHESE